MYHTIQKCPDTMRELNLLKSRLRFLIRAKIGLSLLLMSIRLIVLGVISVSTTVLRRLRANAVYVSWLMILSSGEYRPSCLVRMSWSIVLAHLITALGCILIPMSWFSLRR